MRNRSSILGLTLVGLFLLVGLGMMTSLGKVARRWGAPGLGGKPVGGKDSVVLVLELNGVIMDSKKFLEPLHTYAPEDDVKAVVIQINSPGGAVGPSQEIHREILRVREELKKPVYVACSAVAASGGYYAAVAADKIFANAGTLMGSIGVIMEFANLQDLYGWAKIKRYSLTTGPYKDSGSEYRAMRTDERELFQTMLSEVHMQFKKAVAEGRGLELSAVEKLADGRVFTGETAVKHKMADEIGTLEDAVRAAWAAAGETGEPEVFRPRKRAFDFWRGVVFGDGEDEEARAFRDLSKTIQSLKLQMLGQPLYLMPHFGVGG